MDGIREHRSVEIGVGENSRKGPFGGELGGEVRHVGEIVIATMKVEDRRGAHGVRGISRNGHHVVIRASVRHIDGRTGGIARHSNRCERATESAIDPQLIIHNVVRPIGKVLVGVLDRGRDHKLLVWKRRFPEPLGFQSTSINRLAMGSIRSGRDDVVLKRRARNRTVRGRLGAPGIVDDPQ